MIDNKRIVELPLNGRNYLQLVALSPNVVAEYWVVLNGQIRFPLEGQEIFILNEGDLAYAPTFTRHEPRGLGDGPAWRLAMDGVTSLTSGGRDGKHAR